MGAHAHSYNSRSHFVTPSAFSDIQSQRLLKWMASPSSSSAANSIPIPHEILTNVDTKVHFEKFKYGQSNPTYKLSVTNVKSSYAYYLVLRSQPPGPLLPGAHRLDREFKVLKALGSYTNVPVPNVYLFNNGINGSILPKQQFYIMEYMNGEIFNDLSFSTLSSKDRKQVYSQSIRILKLLNDVNIHKIGLTNLSKSSPTWLNKQIQTWNLQIQRTSQQFPDIHYPKLFQLYNKLISHPIYDTNSNEINDTLVHGDFRIDNLVFKRNRSNDLTCIAVLDWELVSLGNTSADFTNLLIPYLLSHEVPHDNISILKSIKMPVPLPKGVPTLNELINDYLKNISSKSNLKHEAMRTQVIPIYVSVNFYRMAGVLCGVLARSKQGNASYEHSESFAQHIHYFIDAGLRALDNIYLYSENNNNHSITEVENNDIESRIWKFMDKEILPLENNYFEHINSDKRWLPWQPLEDLKRKAKNLNLWNLFLPNSLGGTLSTEQYSMAATIMGRCLYASEVFNCSAPDTGNMELLARYGTKQQKEKWLKPLLNGEIRSCFAMTEPEVASSNATNLQTIIEKDNLRNEYIVNGRKWWTSGAMDKRCKVMLLIGKGPISTNNDSNQQQRSQQNRHRQHTVLIIPMNHTPGMKILRYLKVFGYDDAPHGHAEIELENLRIPQHDSLLYKEGSGFEVAQSRLGGGRLHHCMRLVGVAERSLEMLITRANSRNLINSKNMLQNDSVLQIIGTCKCEIENMKAMIKETSRAVDKSNSNSSNKSYLEKARLLVGVTKVLIPNTTCKIIDHAIQIHGGMGVCQDTILSMMYAHVRTLRIADGPDEVHLLNVAKYDIRQQLAKL